RMRATSRARSRRASIAAAARVSSTAKTRCGVYPRLAFEEGGTMNNWQVADVNEIPPVKEDWPATWKSVRHHFGIEAFGVNAVTKDAGNVLIPEHTEEESGQQELYFVHAGEVKATLDGDEVSVPAG